MQLIHWFFVFVFLFVSPIVRLVLDSFPLSELSADKFQVITQVNWLVLIWSFVFAAGSQLARRNATWLTIKRVGKPTYLIGKAALVVLTLSLIAAYVTARTPLGWISRGGGIGEAFPNNTIKLIFQYCARPFALFSFFLMSLRWKHMVVRRVSAKLLLIGGGALMLLYNIPTSTARFYAFAIYLTLALILLEKYLPRTGYATIPVLFLGIAVAELINLFRSYSGGALDLEEREQQGFEFWISVQFDAYEMISASAQHVAYEGTVAGQNIVGAVLFWVPRAIWPTKPIGTGAYLMTDFFGSRNPYGAFANVSCPLIAESYIAFGIVGVAIGALTFGYVSRSLDNGFAACVSYLGNAPAKRINQLIYFPLCALVFFIMRGDLLSSYAYTAGLILAYITAVRYYGLRVRTVSSQISDIRFI